MKASGLFVEDFGGGVFVADELQLVGLLRKRYANGVNELWFSRANCQYPAMSLMLRDDLCCLHYFPSDGHPGFISQAKDPKPPSSVEFASGSPEMIQEVPSTYVIPLSAGIAAAKQFLESPEKPSVIEWYEL